MVLSARSASEPAATRQVHVGLLGPLHVAVDGSPVPIDAPKERALLAVLALHAGRTVSVSNIVDALWGDDPPASATKLVQTYVSSLRDRLGGDSIVTEPGGYSLREIVTSTDTDRFADLAAEGRRCAADGDLDRARQHFDEALALWRGDPLADLADAPTSWGQRTRFDEQRLAVVEHRIDVDLAAGRHRELVPELELVVHHQPFRERPWASLMLALYRSGRPGEALRAAARLRTLLAEEIGISPSPLVTDLEARILAEDRSLDLPPIPATGNVPGTLSSFVGRSGDIDRLIGLIADRPLVTLLGVGGVGKSRLALEAARRLRTAGASTAEGAPIESVWWVELGSVHKPDGIARQVAHAMGVEVAPAAGLDDALAGRLRASTAVLVLDNCEHLVEPVAAFVNWARSVSSTHLVATSRVALGVTGEYRWHVEPLGLPESVPTVDESDAARLFLDRAGDHVEVDTLDLQQIGRICAIVDGLPLAIELVAAMCALSTPAEILATLEDPGGVLGLTGTVDRGAGADRVSLGDVLDIRRSGLDPATRDAFLALSVFPGDFSPAAACAVIGGEPVAARQALHRLVEASLVTSGHEQDATRRFRMLWPVRQFADELITTQRRDVATAAHAAYFRTVANEVAAAIEGRHEADRIAELGVELHNVTAALAWNERHGTPESILELALALSVGWDEWGQYDLGRQHLGRLLQAADDAPPELVAWIRLQLVWPTLMGGDPASGLDLAETALIEFERIGDRRGIARALRDRAHVRLVGFADAAGAFADYQRSIEIADEAGHTTLAARARALFVQSLALAEQRDLVDTERLLNEAETVFIAEGNHLGLAQVEFDRVFLAFGRGDDGAVVRAAHNLERHSRLARSLVYEQAALVAQAVQAHRIGQRQRCAGLIERALHIAEHSGNRVQVGIALEAAAVSCADRDPRRAATLWGASLELAPLWPLFARRYGEMLEPARDALGDDFDRLVEAGRGLPLTEAIRLSDEFGDTA